jgi:hypothetical protein
MLSHVLKRSLINHHHDTDVGQTTAPTSVGGSIMRLMCVVQIIKAQYQNEALRQNIRAKSRYIGNKSITRLLLQGRSLDARDKW